MNQRNHRDWSNLLILAAAVILLVYAIAALAGIPQAATAGVNHADHPAEENIAPQHPPLVMLGPFAILLGAIAVFPLTKWTSHWWESNLKRFYFSIVLGAFTLAYYLFAVDYPIVGHWPGLHLTPPAEAGPNLAIAWDVLATAILKEYIPFMILLFGLYTISGGIRVEGDLPAHPLTNSAFFAVGSVLASIIGTTGAAMVLIRPLLETNGERKHVKHTVIFFIFIVCNCGGCLLPTGDPPLFLGYLRGVHFLWTLRLWPEWLLINGILIAIYYILDRYWFYPRERPADLARDEKQVRSLRIIGLWPNAFLLAAVVAAAGLLDPGKPFPGTDWHPWLYLREIAQLCLIALSLLPHSRQVRAANNFNFHAIVEVAVLFFGLFICMQPPLQMLDVEGPRLGLSQPSHFFWATGGLSAMLDNAPTYVVFFETAKSLTAQQGLPALSGAGVAENLLVGISLGAVFMGAMTYIGNGPNFMVKSIAEKSGVAMPGFFGYMLYSCAILLPLLAITSFLFFR
jgi:Na+/H+ antiporter NhaD/arsenite permease-like protein